MHYLLMCNLLYILSQRISRKSVEVTSV